jgi:hypothetical protein
VIRTAQCTKCQNFKVPYPMDEAAVALMGAHVKECQRPRGGESDQANEPAKEGDSPSP